MTGDDDDDVDDVGIEKLETKFLTQFIVRVRTIGIYLVHRLNTCVLLFGIVYNDEYPVL